MTKKGRVAMPSRSLEDFKSGMGGKLGPAQEAVAKMDPEYFQALKEYYFNQTIARHEAKLPRMIKEIIIMSVCAAQSNRRGVEIHMRRALKSGANPRHILEALQTAAIPGGLPILWLGAEVLKQQLKRSKISLKRVL